jgi:hypothetical protein
MNMMNAALRGTEKNHENVTTARVTRIRSMDREEPVQRSELGPVAGTCANELTPAGVDLSLSAAITFSAAQRLLQAVSSSVR